MALDSQNKRRSVLGLCSPTVRPLPIPDGTISLGDRYHLALMYNSGAEAQLVNSLIGRVGLRSYLDGVAGQRSRLEGLAGQRTYLTGTGGLR